MIDIKTIYASLLTQVDKCNKVKFLALRNSYKTNSIDRKSLLNDGEKFKKVKQEKNGKPFTKATQYRLYLI